MADVGPSAGPPLPSRRRPPRRPRRRCGRADTRVSHSASAVDTPARTAFSSAQSSGLRRWARSVSWSRSSGLRARRAIRCINSPYLARNRAASAAPSVRPRTDWSSTITEGTTRAAAGAAACAAAFCWARISRHDRAGCSRSRSRSRSRGIAISRLSACQSNDTSGWVCSSAIRASSSNGRRPTVACDGDRNRYSTRVRPGPCMGR